MAEELGADRQHSPMSRVREPRGDVTSEIRGEFSVQAASVRPDWLTGIILPTVVQFDPQEEGTHTIEYEIDGSVAALAIHIARGLPGPFG